MNGTEGNAHDTPAYAATLEAAARIPRHLMTILTRQYVVDRLRTEYGSYLDASPFMFSAVGGHVWQVLEALEAVCHNNYASFSRDKEGDELDEEIFRKFVSLAHELHKDQRMATQVWIVVLLHDIAKYSIRDADHAPIGGYLVEDLFTLRTFGLTEHEQERVAWAIRNHDVVGNIVSSAERAPRCLTEALEKLSDREKQLRLDMLILVSFCDLRGTRNGAFANDYNAESRFSAGDFSWLREKEEDLFGWRKERLVRASTQSATREKQSLWDSGFRCLPDETQAIVRRQFGRDIKVFTNLLYLALRLDGKELVKLFALISLMAEMATKERRNRDFQVDFAKGGERGKAGAVVKGFKSLLRTIELEDLTPDRVAAAFDGQTIWGIPAALSWERLGIDSERVAAREQT